MTAVKPGAAAQGDIGLLGALSIGIGGIVGGGIFATLGLAVSDARGSAWLSFLVAGVVALLTAYSYSKLSIAFPSTGGTFAGVADADVFAARWTGQIRIDDAGLTRFYLASDDGSRLYIDNHLVVDNGGLHAFAEASG